jgi:hypothetical protein
VTARRERGFVVLSAWTGAQVGTEEATMRGDTHLNSAVRLLLPYLAGAVGIFAACRLDGYSLESSILQAIISSLVVAAIWELIVYVRKRDEL